MKKIIWALDVFQTEKKLQKAAVDLLRKLTAETGAQIEPVYVLSPSQVNLSLEFAAPWMEKYEKAAEKALRFTVSEAELPSLMKPRLLVQKAPSLSRAVTSLNAHAVSSGADLIVVGTHAKKGLERAFLGSFAESLLLSSNVPVITVNPASKITASKDHIVFATDLATDYPTRANAAFEEVLALAKDLQAKLTIFHSVPNPIEPVLQSGVYLLGGGWVPVSAYLKEETSKQKAAAQDLVMRAKEHGIAAKAVVSAGRNGIAQDLIQYAENESASLIALTGKSGPVAATLIGSVVRQVVRSAHCPVWVVRPAAKSKKKGTRASGVNVF